MSRRDAFRPFRPMLGALAGVVAIATGAPAHAEDDAQIWGSMIASGAVRGDLFLWLEAQPRATDSVGGGSQVLLRPAIGARVARDAHAVLGYAYVRTDPETGSTTNEHRIWQQLQVPLLRTARGAPLVVSRTRLEQRRLEGRNDTGWRLRQFLRLQAPVARQGTIQAVAFTEGFFNLNATEWGARDGVDQWRTFVGIGLPVTRGMRLEPGYLNQHVFRRGEDRTNHVLNATLFVTL